MDRADEGLSARLGEIPVKPYTEWLDALHRAHDAAAGFSSDKLKEEDDLKAVFDDNPALRLLDFFDNRVRAHHAVTAELDSDSLEPIGMPRLDCERATKMSCSLAALAKSGRQLDGTDVDRWVTCWEDIGFLERP